MVRELIKDTSGQKAGKKWLKITIKAEPQLVESISDYLVGVFDAGVETGARDELLYGTVNGYIQKADLLPHEVDGILGQVSAYLSELAEIFSVQTPILSSTMIEEEDWGKSWKQHFKPFAIVPGLVIAPTWEEYRPAAGEAVLVMDPGMAFGTGHHATTSLSVDFIRQTLAQGGGQRLLDVGTGTGILGMAALLFGAGDVLGIDNDPEAVSAAEQNVQLNSLQEHMQVSLAPLSALQESFAIVVANIVHDVLVRMADDLTRLTADGGTLILSGILAGDQVASITDVFTARGMRLSGRQSCQEWAALCFKKE
ncbi:50S ribosomal protein L11 methyltransferase [Desulfopila sp. IMCC35006]|nr:50S ribosomal protein L11 methyltransferase [Desulfopila sp. IMCC35006]